MREMNYIARQLLILLLCCLPLMQACTTVDLCYEEDHPHRAIITARYDWGADAADAPTEMNIIANRIYNTWRNHGIADTKTGYCWQGQIPASEQDYINRPTNPEPEPEPEPEPGEGEGEEEEGEGENNNASTRAEGDETDTPSDNEEEEDANKDPNGFDKTKPYKLRSGEFNFITINAYKGLVIDKLQEYLDNPANNTDSLFFHLEETPREELAELEGLDMPDFNPKYRYVHNPGRLFYGTSQNIKIQTGEDKEIEFTPTPISKQVTVKFNVRTIGDIQVEKLIAEMSGICGRFNITENYLDTTNLYRLLFIPEEESVQDVPDEPSQKIRTYTATFHIMGLVPSYRSTYLIGPGILQVAVYAATEGKRRIFYAGANPRKDLVEARILRVEDGKTYLRDTEPITIILSGELVIDAQHILNRDDGRFDIWFSSDEEFIDVDV
ncbi:MAG: hypothetical protein ACI4C3_10095 [Bacteroides sp.]